MIDIQRILQLLKKITISLLQTLLVTIISLLKLSAPRILMEMSLAIIGGIIKSMVITRVR
jgi:hypothetical protein